MISIAARKKEPPQDVTGIFISFWLIFALYLNFSAGYDRIHLLSTTKYIYYLTCLIAAGIALYDRNSMRAFLGTPFSKWLIFTCALFFLNIVRLRFSEFPSDLVLEEVDRFQRMAMFPFIAFLVFRCSKSHLIFCLKIAAVTGPLVLVLDFFMPELFAPTPTQATDNTSKFRSEGFYGNPNPAAEAVVLCIIILSRFVRNHHLAFFYLLGGAGIIFTFSRSGIGLWLIIGIIFVWRKLAPAYLLTIIFGLGIVISLAAELNLLQNLILALTDSESLANVLANRLTFWKDTLDGSQVMNGSAQSRSDLIPLLLSGISDRPILGHGISFLDPTWGEGAHNLPLALWFKFGILGLFLWLWLIFVLKDRTSDHLFLLPAVITYVWYSLFSHNIYEHVFWLVFLSMAAFVPVYKPMKKKRRRRTKSRKSSEPIHEPQRSEQVELSSRTAALQSGSLDSTHSNAITARRSPFRHLPWAVLMLWLATVLVWTNKHDKIGPAVAGKLEKSVASTSEAVIQSTDVDTGPISTLTHIDEPAGKAQFNSSDMPHLGELKIFPGAEGFGTDSVGGRGGIVCRVTNTNATGPGSLRACVEVATPRVVVFTVGGTIELNESIEILNPYISIFGQTAPGDGILVRMSLDSEDTPVRVKTHDVLIQHLRLRAGSSTKATCCRDGAGIGGRDREVYNVVLDHNSISWGTDQIAHTWYDVHNVTISNNIISESLHDNGSNIKGPAGRGLIVGSNGAHSISIHHNFFAHSYQRNPLLKISGIADVVNNLVYHWVSRGGHQSSTYPGMKVNWVKNRYIELTDQRSRAQNSSLGWGDILLEKQDYPIEVYFEGNIGHRRPTDDLPEWTIAMIDHNTPYQPELGYHSPVRFFAPPITEIPADALESSLPDTVGAYLPKRDEVDRRLLHELKTRTGKMPNCVSRDDKPEKRCRNHAGGWPDINSGQSPDDSDRDGMPDYWEILHGLNPHEDDSADDQNSDGYSNIEAWVHSIERLR